MAAARAAALPPLQSVLELTTAFRPPSRGEAPELAAAPSSAGQVLALLLLASLAESPGCVSRTHAPLACPFFSSAPAHAAHWHSSLRSLQCWPRHASFTTSAWQHGWCMRPFQAVLQGAMGI